MAEANAYAPSFIEDFNQLFAKPPRNDLNVHRPVRVEVKLTIDAMFKETDREHYLRVRWLFSLLYLCGLRISEDDSL